MKVLLFPDKYNWINSRLIKHCPMRGSLRQSQPHRVALLFTLDRYTIIIKYYRTVNVSVCTVWLPQGGGDYRCA